MIVQIVNPFDATERYDSLYTLNLRRGAVINAQLNFSINQPNELNITFTPNMPPQAYDLLQNTQYGIRLIKDGIDMLFVQDSASKKTTAEGLIECRFYSGLYKAIYSEPTLLYRQFVNESGIVAVNQVQGFEFQLISSDVTLTVNAGVNNNYDFINELRKASGAWSMFDAGLKARGDGTYSNQILIGNYNEIDKYGAIDSRFKTETLQTRKLANWLSNDPVLTNLTVFNNGRQIQFLYPVLDTGQGAGTQNASAVFTRTDYDFVDPYFPLVNINGRIYIQNTQYGGLEERFVTYPVTFTANSQDENGNQILNVNTALSYLYRKAVYYMKTQSETKRYDCQIAMRKLTFPKYLNIRANKSVRNLLGQKTTIFNINEKILYKEMNFDLTKL